MSRPVSARDMSLLRRRPAAGQTRAIFVHQGTSPKVIEYSLRRSTRKTIGFQIDERGLTISAPRWVPIREIEAAIREKNRWIVEKQAEWRAFERARARSAPRYADGGHIRLLGRRVTLRCNPYTDRYKRTHYLLAGDELWIAGPGADDPSWLEAKVTAWLKQQARYLFELRLARSAPDLFPMLEVIYGARPDYPAFREKLVKVLRKGWAERPEDLKRLDLQRDLEPDWFQRPGMAGYVFYIDRFNGTLKGILDKLDYLEDLGITYVHLMPCLKPRPGDSDGGYSVMDYRQINPAFGTMAEFEAVSAALRARGFSLEQLTLQTSCQNPCTRVKPH